jgi:hypothetical protein
MRGKCALPEEMFVYFINMKREHGIKIHWGSIIISLYIDDNSYWTMGAPIEETIVMNRAKITPYYTSIMEYLIFSKKELNLFADLMKQILMSLPD